MPKLPAKNPPAKPGRPVQQAKPDVPKAIRSVVFEAIPEATLIDTGRAMILAGLGEQLGLAIPDIVHQFPAKLVEAGLPDKLPPWVVKLAVRLDNDARCAMLWRYKDRPIDDPRPDKSWSDVKKISSGEVVAAAPKPIAMASTKTAAPTTESFSIFD